MEGENKIKEERSVGTKMSFSPTNCKRMALLTVLSLALMLGLVCASSVTISSTSTVIIKGSTGKVDIRINKVPNGLAGYKMIVELKDKNKGEILDIVPKGLGNNREDQIKLGEDRYEIFAYDLPESVHPGDENVKIATVKLRGKQKGSTKLMLDIHYLDNDEGYNFSSTTGYELDEGTIEVLGSDKWVKLKDSASGPPQDLDGDGLFEDTDGNGQANFDDALTLYNELDNSLVQSYNYLFDFNGDGNVDATDAVVLAFL